MMAEASWVENGSMLTLFTDHYGDSAHTGVRIRTTDDFKWEGTVADVARIIRKSEEGKCQST